MPDQRSRPSRRRDLAATGPEMLPDELVSDPAGISVRKRRISECMIIMSARVREFLRTAPPVGAIGLALLASAAWTTFLMYWAFRTMRWALTSLLLL